jgi:broad-specificity NMP kinase
LLLISGASGVGKSTVRPLVTDLLGDVIEGVELGHLSPVPRFPTKAWRQECVELAVQRAIELDRDGRHLLLSGDPVAAGEVLAAPSADQIDASICLLDATPEVQMARLRGRGDPEAPLVHHVAYAEWLRSHAVDPTHVPEVLTANSWQPMRWERWTTVESGDSRWAMTRLDSSDLDPAEVAQAAAQWCIDSFDGRAPIFPRR